MKTLGKIFIFIVVIMLAIGIAYVSYYGEDQNATNTSSNTTNETNQKNETNNNVSNVTDVENKDYVGKEENVEPEQKPEQEPEENNQDEQQPVELTGKDKAVDIVKKQYALEGQTVRFDHMEGSDYIIKINDGTAVTWYFVDGTTWKAEEY